MKIVLVNVIEFEPVCEGVRGASPRKSTQYPPIGLLTLAAVLEQQNYQVEVIDFGNLILEGEIALDDRLSMSAARYLKERRGDVVGFSSRCDNYLFSLRIAERFRHLDPSTPIVFGGPQATITDVASMQKFDFIDCVVRHEAEFSFPALLEALRCGRAFDDIPGLVYRRGGEVRRNPDPPLILDLDQIPTPAYHHFPIETLEQMPIEVGRGCPFGCTFCVTNRYFNRRYRLKSANRIVEEVIRLRDLYGFTRFDFIHDMLTASRPLVMQLCRRIEESGVRIEWGCSARTDCIDRELLELMRATGCREMYFGIETGSPRMQKVVKKNLKLEGVHPALDMCADLGIQTTASFITGFPEEEREDVEATLRMMVELSPKTPNVQLHLYSPTPGTPLNDRFEDRLVFTGYISDFGFSIPLSEDDRQWITSSPDIFTNYFQVRPLHLDFEEIRGLDVFGYCLRFFRHFLFHLIHQQASPSLYEVWLGLRRWLDDNDRKWDIEAYLGGELVNVLEEYLCALLSNSPRLDPLLFEAFNLDRALIRLGQAARSLPEACKARLKAFEPNGSVRQMDLSTLIQLRAVPVLTRTRCDAGRLIENVRQRQHRNAPLNQKLRNIAIIPIRMGERFDEMTYIIIESSDLMEAALEACRDPITAGQAVGRVRDHLEASGKTIPTPFEQLCLAAIKRLLSVQALSANERIADEHLPMPVRLDPLTPAFVNIASAAAQKDISAHGSRFEPQSLWR
jgi:radical SAM superfamily enzyme YgiQ (UPF0313 family)